MSSIRTLLLFAVIAPWLAPSTGARADEVALELPAGLAWCDTLPVVAEKLGITDTAESGHAYRADGIYLVTGKLWGHDGTVTVTLEPFGEQYYLVAVEFRMFRLQSAWEEIVGKLTGELGPGASEVVAKAAYGPNGEVIAGQRSKYVYRDEGGTWEVVAHQMSNEIDLVKWTRRTELCRPAPTEEAAVEETSPGPRRDRDVFDYDPYADDPLHDDTRAQELEEERKRKAEEEKKTDEETQVDWSEGSDETDDVDVDWDEDEDEEM